MGAGILVAHNAHPVIPIIYQLFAIDYTFGKTKEL